MVSVNGHVATIYIDNIQHLIKLWHSFSCVQAVSDIERQWTLGTKEQLRHLATLQQRGSKREVKYHFIIILKI